MTALLLIALFLVAAALTWWYRQRLVRFLPRKNTMFTISIIASIGLLAVLAVLPDLIALLSALQFLSPLVKTALVLVTVVPLVIVGCSRHSPTPDEPYKIHWQAGDSNFSTDTVPANAKPKEKP